ncbi:MAG: hypothetical protein LBL85_01730 [Methanocalculaceae archaeon]|jgi:hypothetical protein|nr:hypothetical protein [Methanocalculaceae archaeon]
MSERRTLTIGVAINVGNYESLRLEVSDCVQTEEEAAELAAYLNCVLDGYAQNDATTRASIDKYRTRVLERHVPETPASPSPDPLDELFGPVPMFDGTVKKQEQETPEPVKVEELPQVPEPVIAESEPVKVGELPQVPEPVIAEPEPVKAEEKPVPAAEEPVTYICEKCGAAVSKVQRDVSNLFMGKTLCKACMK